VTKELVPRAVLFWMFKIPLDIRVVPEKLFAVAKVVVPVPDFVNVPLPREIAVVFTSTFPDPVNIKFVFVPEIPPIRVRVFAEEPIVV
jgi:hypothetical protein